MANSAPTPFPLDIYQTVTVKYDLISGFPQGWKIGTETLGAYVGSLKHLFSAEGAQSIGGFGAMGYVSRHVELVCFLANYCIFLGSSRHNEPASHPGS